MAKRRKVSNLLALAVLARLTERPMHPYELGRLLRESGDTRSIKFNHGSLYMVVQQLAKAGFVAEHETERDGQRPERTLYALTDAGVNELHDWLTELVAVPAHEYPQFVAALSVITALPPSQVLPLLAQRQDALAALRQEAAEVVEGALAQGVDPVFLIEEEYRIALLDAEAAFIERTVKRINEPETGFGRVWREFHKETS